MSSRIRTLLVDDSHFMRLALQRELKGYPDIEVIDSARDGAEAVEKTSRLRPAVVVMDVRMPVMDGIAAVKRIMEVQPTPVVMLSAYTREGASETLDALAAGAVDFVSKPSGEVSVDLTATVADLVSKLRVACGSRPQPRRPRAAVHIPPAAGLLNGQGLHVVAIGASTGGPSALETFLTQIPAHFPAAVVVVQHMPPGFTTALAERLNSICALDVREAAEGDTLQRGVALVVPGDRNLVVTEVGRVDLLPDVERYTFRPCIDVTFRSVAEAFGPRAIGVLLSGMGRDGSEGMKWIKSHGGATLAQDESSSLIFSMPRAAIALNCVDRILPVDELYPELAQRMGTPTRGKELDA